MRSLDKFVKRKRTDACGGVWGRLQDGPDPRLSDEVLAEVGCCKLT
jgi:hypothetical protein